MDNICHTLVGAALGETGLKRRTRFGAAALMIAANLPDVDVFVFATDMPSVAFRRGWTHGIGGQILLPVLVTGAFWLGSRRQPRDGDHAPPLHLGWLLGLSYVGVYSHVFLDYLNNYGVRLLTPFDWQWFYGDAVFIVDPWLWLVLGVGVWLARRRGTPVPSRRALLLAAGYITAMLISTRVARAVVVDRWSDLRGAPPRAVMVGPVPITPFTREIIVDAGNHYERGTFSWPSSLVLLPEQIPKNDDRREVTAAREAPSVRAFLVWSRFPFWTLESAKGGTHVTVTDARFMVRRGAMFSASTIVPTPFDDAQGHEPAGSEGEEQAH
jgi:inner membrane protein